MNPRGWISAAALVAIAALLPAGCGGPPPGPPVTLRIGIFQTQGFLPYLAMQEQGFDKKYGLSFKETGLAGGKAAIDAMAAGTIDMSPGVGVVPLLEAAERGRVPDKVVAIAANTFADPDHLGAGVLVAHTVNTWKDLDGKKVGINARNSFTHVPVDIRLRQEGVRSYSFVEIAFPNLGLAVAGGNITAASMIEPYLTQSLLRGDGKLLGWVIGGPPFERVQYESIVFASDFIRRNPEGVKAFLRAHLAVARTLRYAMERKRLEIELRKANQSLEQRVVERTSELHVAIEATRASEEKFRGLVEQSIAGFYVLQDGKIAYVNPRFAQIMGYDTADELIGRDPLSIVAESDRAEVAATLRGRIDGVVPNGPYGFTALRKDGSLIDVGLDSARAMHQGRPAVIGLMQDISEKKRDAEKIARYLAQLKSAFMRTVEMATTLSEMRDPYTADHERCVAKLAAAIGAELGLDADRQEGLQMAGLLHDIGKIAIPAEILSKPAKLSAVEFMLIQGHALQGYEVLKGIGFAWPVAEVALQHHERMDGSGYPRGLKGEAILLEARIMAVADVVEAMSSHRPYRAALGIEPALAEIERGRGSSYDAAVVDACLSLFRNKGYSLAI